jgi:hypothetical protein
MSDSAAYERLRERIVKHHSATLRDMLREGFRAAGRRKLNEGERDLFLAAVDEIEDRMKEPTRAR